jgi:hypothetical protein
LGIEDKGHISLREEESSYRIKDMIVQKLIEGQNALINANQILVEANRKLVDTNLMLVNQLMQNAGVHPLREK